MIHLKLYLMLSTYENAGRRYKKRDYPSKGKS